MDEAGPKCPTKGGGKSKIATQSATELKVMVMNASCAKLVSHYKDTDTSKAKRKAIITILDNCSPDIVHFQECGVGTFSTRYIGNDKASVLVYSKEISYEEIRPENTRVESGLEDLFRSMSIDTSQGHCYMCAPFHEATNSPSSSTSPSPTNQNEDKKPSMDLQMMTDKNVNDRWCALKITRPAQPTRKIICISWHARNNKPDGKGGALKETDRKEYFKSWMKFLGFIRTKYRLPIFAAGDYNIEMEKIKEFVKSPFTLSPREPHSKRKNKHIDYCIVTEDLKCSYKWMDFPNGTPDGIFDHYPLLATLNMPTADIDAGAEAAVVK